MLECCREEKQKKNEIESFIFPVKCAFFSGSPEEELFIIISAKKKKSRRRGLKASDFITSTNEHAVD